MNRPTPRPAKRASLRGTPRAAAARAAAPVLVRSRYLDAALAETLMSSPGQDAALIQEMAYGVLRWFHGVAAAVPGAAVVVVLIVGAAVLSALMSNTATATLLVPLGLSLVPQPSTAVLIAVACSLGAPFAISTPQNALVAGAGVRGRDFLAVGLPLLVVGVVVVAVTGPAALRWFGL